MYLGFFVVVLSCWQNLKIKARLNVLKILFNMYAVTYIHLFKKASLVGPYPLLKKNTACFGVCLYVYLFYLSVYFLLWKSSAYTKEKADRKV